MSDQRFQEAAPPRDELTVTNCRRHDRVEVRDERGTLLAGLECAWDYLREGHYEVWLRGVVDTYRALTKARA